MTEIPACIPPLGEAAGRFNWSTTGDLSPDSVDSIIYDQTILRVQNAVQQLGGDDVELETSAHLLDFRAPPADLKWLAAGLQ